jgi:hypothetical protein
MVQIPHTKRLRELAALATARYTQTHPFETTMDDSSPQISQSRARVVSAHQACAGAR